MPVMGFQKKKFGWGGGWMSGVLVFVGGFLELF